MKHTIILRPAQSTNGGWLNLSRIKYNGSEYCITRDFQVVKRDQMKQSDEPFMKVVSKGETLTWNYEDSAGDSKNENRKLMATVIQYHHQVISPYLKNPNRGAALLFEFEDLAMNSVSNYNALAMILAAMNKCAQMDYREKINLMYFYGGNPMVSTETGTGVMDHRQLAIRLYDIGSVGGVGMGMILQRSPYATTGKTYLQHFVEDYQAANPTTVLKTNILKGFVLKDGDGKPLLKKEGSAVLMGDSIIGSSIDECVVWFNNNPEKKNFLDRMVKQSDTVDADNLDEAIQESHMNNVEQVLAPNRTESDVRQEGEKLRVVGYYNHPIPEVEKRIFEAKKIWKEVDNLGLMPKIDASKTRMSLEKIEKLVHEEKKRLSELV